MLTDSIIKYESRVSTPAVCSIHVLSEDHFHLIGGGDTLIGVLTQPIVPASTSISLCNKKLNHEEDVVPSVLTHGGHNLSSVVIQPIVPTSTSIPFYTKIGNNTYCSRTGLVTTLNVELDWQQHLL